jgi:N-acetyl-anhydromuramyl-L-alanine amidase AmpD
MTPKYIIIHHTASSRDKTTVKDVNAWHKVRNFTLSNLGYYVGYHYLILSNGDVVQIRQDFEVGCHCIAQNMNFQSIGVCLTGNFETETPSEQQFASLTELLERKLKDFNIPKEKVLGHKEVSSTECPGKNLFKWLLLYRQVSLLQKLINFLLSKLKGQTI